MRASNAMPGSSSNAHHEFLRGTTVMTIQKMAAVGAASVLSCVVATTAAQSQVRINGSTATFALPSQTNQAARGIDFANAKPMVIPAARTLPPAQAQAIASALDPLQVFGAPGSWHWRTEPSPV